MATFVMLTRLTDQGARTVKESPGHILEVNEQLAAMGVKVVQQYAVLGRYDFVNVVDAPSVDAVMKASLELGARGSIRIETLPATPVADLIGMLK
ncbi:MAG: GYD domain-containing protein [Actinobacteria bacterium]|nr:GYD domain-containing protein [Actinomycetota bacterium]